MAGHLDWVVSILPEVPLFILCLELLLLPLASTWENAVTVALSVWRISLIIPHMSCSAPFSSGSVGSASMVVPPLLRISGLFKLASLLILLLLVGG